MHSRENCDSVPQPPPTTTKVGPIPSAGNVFCLYYNNTIDKLCQRTIALNWKRFQTNAEGSMPEFHLVDLAVAVALTARSTAAAQSRNSKQRASNRSPRQPQRVSVIKVQTREAKVLDTVHHVRPNSGTTEQKSKTNECEEGCHDQSGHVNQASDDESNADQDRTNKQQIVGGLALLVKVANRSRARLERRDLVLGQVGATGVRTS